MDTEKFAGCIDELLRNKNLARRMGRRGMELVNANYNSNRQIDRLESLFNDLIKRNRPNVGDRESVQQFSE